MNGGEQSICIVDDDVSVRESLAGLVRSAGLQVETFASAREYLKTARELPPACLVLDVNLPGFSGLELQQELLRGGASVPILFITGQGDVPMSVRAFKAGALDFFTKPFDSELLLDAIMAAAAQGKRSKTCATRSQGRSASIEARLHDGIELL